MLAKDERNFHCWNYRTWLLSAYIDEIKSREIEKKEEVIAYIYHTEYERCFEIIKKNFLNYSAWFYLSKLCHLVFPDSAYEYSLLEQKHHYDMLVSAVHTDPKCEGIWSIFEWVIDIRRPITVLKYTQLNEKELIIVLTDCVNLKKICS